MFGEILVSFVGAISGGVVLALLTWHIYRKEKLAVAYQKAYTVKDILERDKKTYYLNINLKNWYRTFALTV